MPTASVLHSDYLYDTFPGCPSCHASYIVEAPDRTLVAGCYAGTKEGHSDSKVLLSRKEPGAAAWQTCVLWDEPGHAAGNVRLFERSDGKLQVIYALNFGEWCRGGSRLYQQVSDDAGKTWSEQVAIPCEPPLLGKNRPVKLSDGTLVMPMTVEQRPHASAALISTDDGDTWCASKPGAAADGTDILQPAGVELDPGVVLFLHRTNGGLIYRSTSNDGGRTWSDATPTPLPNNHSGIDLAKLSDGTIALIYNPVGKSWGPRTPLCLAVSTDQGENWQNVLTLEDEPGEYSYPAIIQSRDGLLHATYTYRRERIKHVAVELSG